LTYGRTYDELEDLILTQARRLHRTEVFVGDLRRPLGDPADEPLQRTVSRGIVERGTPLSS
jgi:hypothetical protein